MDNEIRADVKWSRKAKSSKEGPQPEPPAMTRKFSTGGYKNKKGKHTEETERNYKSVHKHSIGMQ